MKTISGTVPAETIGLCPSGLSQQTADYLIYPVLTNIGFQKTINQPVRNSLIQQSNSGCEERVHRG